MARVQNTLIGRASGSVGMVVFLTWRLLNVTRSKPSSVANPNTIPQQYQRNRFAQTVGLYQLLRPILEVGFINRNRKMTLFNAFQHWNMKTAFQDAGGGLAEFLPQNLIVSKGLLQVKKINNVIAQNGYTSCEWYWPGNINGIGLSYFDKAYCCAINMTQGTIAMSLGTAMRNINYAISNFTSNCESGDYIIAYVFFKSELNGDVSDSYFLDFTVV